MSMQQAGTGIADRTGAIIEPDASHLVGLVAAHREPHTPLVSAMLHEARLVAAELGAFR